MKPNRPIIIVEDDADDTELMIETINQLNYDNEIKCFPNGEEALEYLTVTSDRPLVIISDINMPKMDGFALRKEITKSEYLTEKSIPFIFLSTTASDAMVVEAYKLTVQGFFVKPNSTDHLKSIVKNMISYWIESRHPNSILKN